MARGFEISVSRMFEEHFFNGLLTSKIRKLPSLDLQLYLFRDAVSCRFRRGFDGSAFPAVAGARDVPAQAR